MPKIIVGLRERLVEEAERELLSVGYAAMTIRTVAKNCGVAVGTVYNYFPSKEAFVAEVLLERWHRAFAGVAALTDASPEVLLRRMYDELTDFIDHYRVLFRDEAAIAVFAATSARYHDLTRSQLAQPLLRLTESEFEAEFVAEALLSWTVAGEGFEAIYQVIQKIVK